MSNNCVKINYFYNYLKLLINNLIFKLLINKYK